MNDAKRHLRKQILEKRRLLDHQVWSFRNDRIFKHLKTFLQGNNFNCVHTFLPIKRNKEVNTWKVVNYLLASGIKIAISKTDFTEKKMLHYLYHPDIQMIENELGIPEPEDGINIDIHEIDCVIVPLLAFDRQGKRLGYGGGYYDRFLSKISSGVSKIGLGLTGPFDNFNFMESYDVPLDFGITPIEILQFHE